jgi:hypothetical protein
LRSSFRTSANPISIADANLVIGQTIDREVSPQLTVFEVIPSKVNLPVSIGPQLINHYGALLSTVANEVNLGHPHRG